MQHNSELPNIIFVLNSTRAITLKAMSVVSSEESYFETAHCYQGVESRIR